MQSRSILRRKAAMRGETAPRFDNPDHKGNQNTMTKLEHAVTMNEIRIKQITLLHSRIDGLKDTINRQKQDRIDLENEIVRQTTAAIDREDKIQDLRDLIERRDEIINRRDDTIDFLLKASTEPVPVL